MVAKHLRVKLMSQHAIGMCRSQNPNRHLNQSCAREFLRGKIMDGAGVIPPELARLHALEKLDISDNKLTGESFLLVHMVVLCRSRS